MRTVRYIETTHERDPDHDAGLPDAELRIGFTYYPGVPEQGPTYASGGQPAEPEFAEFYYVQRMVGGVWIEAPEFKEWAEAWLDNEGQEIACQAVADDEEDARERAAEARAEMRRAAVAALFVQADGCYSGLPGVDPWPLDRDARRYAGPHPVVAHPECQRWGRFWHGSTRKPHQFTLGDDGGCFAAAMAAVERFGGVLEHPADSHAWAAFGIAKPPRAGGWRRTRAGWTCHVEQAHYGHFSRKPTWLYAAHVDVPDLIWGPAPPRQHPVALERYGYEKARRIGMMAMVGGKRKTEIRNATPPEFRDVLLSIARTACPLAPMDIQEAA